MLCQSCSKEIEIFSIGNCNHPMCHVCATKLRVFQNSKLCVCRRELGADDRSYDAFQNLIYRACRECPADPFPVSSSLADHMREKHELFCCEFCAQKIERFSIHQKRNKTPYKFFAIRQYHIIRERYMSREDLFMHMMMVHRFCHICLAKDKQYVNEYKEEENLREHFRRDHFLCEDGDCAVGKSVFMSMTELRDHQMKAHSSSVYAVPTLLPWSRMNRSSISVFTANHTGGGRWRRRLSRSQNGGTACSETAKKTFSCLTIQGLYRLATSGKATHTEVTIAKWRSSETEIAADSANDEYTELRPCVTSYILAHAPKIPFIISTTAPEHMIKFDDVLSKVEPIRTQFRVLLAGNDERVDSMVNAVAEKVGHLLFSTGRLNGQRQRPILLTRVLLVPELTVSMLSAKRLVDDGCDLVYTTDSVRVIDPVTDELLFEGKGSRGLWKVQLECHEITKEMTKKYTPLEIYEVESEKKLSVDLFWDR